MSLVYQYDCNGYFVGTSDDYGGPLPHGCTLVQPVLQEGFIPRWAGEKWEQVEDHKGKSGYDGQTQTPTDYWMPNDTWDTPARHMTEFGPLPEGALLAAPDKPLEVAKAEAKSRLKAYRQQVEYGGFMLNGQRWDSEQKDELRLNSAYKIFENGIASYPGWKISDGIYVTLTPELLQAASLGLMQHYGRAFYVEAIKIAQIDALTSAEEVDTWLETQLEEGWAQDA